jgi:hypothetical protein
VSLLSLPEGDTDIFVFGPEFFPYRRHFIIACGIVYPVELENTRTLAARRMLAPYLFVHDSYEVF